jgi:hypothetical protein
MEFRMADDEVWQAPVLEEDGRPVAQDPPPLTITGMLQDAAKPRPTQGTALSLFMNDQELADAGIPVTVSNGAGLGKPVAPIAGSKDAGIPEAPPGVSVDDNMRRARQLQDTIMNGMPGDMPPPDPAYGIMTAWFRKGHEMDYKKDGHQYQDFGNFNYGAVGSRLGIGPYMLHGAAGVAQMMDGGWNKRLGLPFLTGQSGDLEGDYKQIDGGIGYEKTHKAR